jgi:hypothetical protein
MIYLTGAFSSSLENEARNVLGFNMPLSESLPGLALWLGGD